MKDYSLNLEESKKFILNYEIEEATKNLIINLASGEKYPVPYTIENEKKILKKMKEQVLNSDKSRIKIEKNIKHNWKYLIFDILMIVFNVFNIKMGCTISPKGSAIFAAMFMIFTIIRTVYMIESKKTIKDINKQQMFLENEELLNEKIMSNSNILLNTNEKTKDIVISNKNDMFYSNKKKKKVFNLNNIDKIKYKEIEKMLENIKRDEEFGFDYSSASKVKVKEKVIYGQHEEC